VEKVKLSRLKILIYVSGLNWVSGKDAIMISITVAPPLK
jgi:hypothetical protein